MNSYNTHLDASKAKTTLRSSSAILLLLWFFPVIFIINIDLELFVQTAFSVLLYGSPFAIAGISGLLISKNNNPAYFRALSIIFIFFLVYCAFHFVILLIYIVSFLTGKLASSGSQDKHNDDDNEEHNDGDNGLNRAATFILITFFGLIATYLIVAIWMGLKGFRASKLIRDILILEGSPGRYQQVIDMVNFQASNPANHQLQFDVGNANFNAYTSIMNTYPLNTNAYSPGINAYR